MTQPSDFLPQPPLKYDAGYQARLNQTITAALFGNTRAGLRNSDGTVGKYVVRNFTRTLVLDLATATQTDINNFVCTVLADIIQRGQVS